MARYAVLLRGINVGRNNRIAMADLRELLADAGFTDVRTHLNSGNVVLSGDDAQAARIEKAITDRTGLAIRCVVLTEKQLRAIVEGHPFAEIATNGSRMLAHVLGGKPEAKAVQAAVALDPDRTAAGPGVIYQWCPDGFLAAPAVTEDLGVLVTARNWNTITKLDDLLREPTPAAPAGRRRPAGRRG